jgi:D-alanyl-D-alanine-carboxypeptidase/D-alanyl-D-alanine-endopeptidase
MTPFFKAGVVFVGVFLLMAAPGYAQQAVDLPAEVLESIHERVDYGDNVGIVVGVIDEDRPRYYGYGRVAAASDQAPDEHTVFEIGSITKVFTAILLADMAERGELALDDPIQKWDIPTLAGAGAVESLTLHQNGQHVPGTKIE